MFLFDKKPTKKSLYKELLPTVPLFQIFSHISAKTDASFNAVMAKN